MKIVDIAEFYSPHGGGVRTYIDQKLAAAAAHGIDMTIVAPAAADAVEPREAGKVVWVKAPRLPVDKRYHQFFSGRGVHAVLDAEKPDILEASSFWKGAWLAADWPGSAVKSLVIHQDPVAVYPHTLFDRWLNPARIDRLFGWFWAYLRRLDARFDTSITAGVWLADRLAAHGMARPSAIPFGIDRGAFSPALRDAKTRQALLAQCGITDTTADLLIAVSRHHPEKRLGTLIDGFARAARSRPMGLYLIGDGPARRMVEAQAKHNAHIHIAGPVQDRPRLARMLASADAFVHAGAAETFGLVIAEALASGLPLILPDRGGAADLAGPGYSESYVTGNSAACGDAILRLLAREQSVLREAASAAAERRLRTTAEHFTALFRHYDSLLPHPATSFVAAN